MIFCNVEVRFLNCDCSGSQPLFKPAANCCGRFCFPVNAKNCFVPKRGKVLVNGGIHPKRYSGVEFDFSPVAETVYGKGNVWSVGKLESDFSVIGLHEDFCWREAKSENTGNQVFWQIEPATGFFAKLAFAKRLEMRTSSAKNQSVGVLGEHSCPVHWNPLVELGGEIHRPLPLKNQQVVTDFVWNKTAFYVKLCFRTRE